MSRAISPVTGKPYGLAAVCRAWRLARSGIYRHQSPPPATPPRRRGPLGAMSDDALTTAIRGVLAASPFHGEGHRKVWARLRYAGTRTSLRRVLRLMRQNNLLAPARVGSPRGPRSRDGTIIHEMVDVMWGTDLTTTITGEGLAAVFIAVDHCSAECVGIHAHARATRFEALEPIRQGVRGHFGGFARGIARGLAVRHDHGSQYMSDRRHPPAVAIRTCREHLNWHAVVRPHQRMTARSLTMRGSWMLPCPDIHSGLSLKCHYARFRSTCTARR
jgi:putative transposase